MVFLFQEPILAQRIQFFIADYFLVLFVSDTYYWRMNLFGCSKADGNIYIHILYTKYNVIMYTNDSFCLKAILISEPMETSSSVCPDPTVIPTVSSPVPVFITITSTVTTIIKETPVDQESDNCQMELIIGITAPVGTILILIVFTVIVLIVCIAKKGKRYGYNYIL